MLSGKVFGQGSVALAVHRDEYFRVHDFQKAFRAAGGVLPHARVEREKGQVDCSRKRSKGRKDFLEPLRRLADLLLRAFVLPVPKVVISRVEDARAGQVRQVAHAHIGRAERPHRKAGQRRALPFRKARAG